LQALEFMKPTASRIRFAPDQFSRRSADLQKLPLERGIYSAWRRNTQRGL